jgi:hypothetical protein
MYQFILVVAPIRYEDHAQRSPPPESRAIARLEAWLARIDPVL